MRTPARHGNDRKVLLVEDDQRGHRLSYIGLLARYCLDRGWQVRLLTTLAVRESEAFALHLGDLGDALDVTVIPEHSYSTIVDASSDWAADVTVVPDGDGWLAPFAWKRGWAGAGRVSLLVMRGSAQGKSTLETIVKDTAKKSLIAILRRFRDVDVLVLASSLHRNRGDGRFIADPISFAPDTASAVKLLKACPKFKPEIRWVTVAGAITARKNLPMILDAVRRIRRCDLGIVIAGKIDPDVRSSIAADLRWLEENRVPVVMLDRLLSEGELDGILVLSDAVVLAHSNEGPSGILGKAVRAGSFVVASGAQSLREDCRSLRRSVWTELSADDIARGISYALDQTSSGEEGISNTTDFCEALLGVSQMTC